MLFIIQKLVSTLKMQLQMGQIVELDPLIIDQLVGLKVFKSFQ